jgi:CDP-glucose 4,6-dehydratase
MSSRVLVTGATGMVGAALTRRLVDQGATVAAFVLDPDPQSELYRSGTVDAVSVASGALEDVDALERAVLRHEADTIYHLGAQTIVGAARRAPAATFETNVRGTWNVLEVSRRHADLVRRVVVASSDKAYGPSSVLPYREDMPLAGREPYEASKSAADIVTQSYAAAYGTPAVIARCGNIYGPGDLNWSRIVPGTFRSLLLGEQPVLRSDGTFVRDYLHVDDVVDAYLALAHAVADGTLEPGEACNFSDEAPLTVMEIYEATCRAAGRPGTAPRILGEATEEIHDQWLSAEKARTRLGWAPKVGLEDGLARTFEWYRALLRAAA